MNERECDENRPIYDSRSSPDFKNIHWSLFLHKYCHVILYSSPSAWEKRACKNINATMKIPSQASFSCGILWTVIFEISFVCCSGGYLESLLSNVHIIFVIYITQTILNQDHRPRYYSYFSSVEFLEYSIILSLD